MYLIIVQSRTNEYFNSVSIHYYNIIRDINEFLYIENNVKSRVLRKSRIFLKLYNLYVNKSYDSICIHIYNIIENKLILMEFQL